LLQQKQTRKLLGERNGLKIYTKLAAKTGLKSKKRINPTSKERYEQNQKEKELKQKLLERCGGLCECCHQLPDWRGLSKHEKFSVVMVATH
jgi:hypothetical protein